MNNCIWIASIVLSLLFGSCVAQKASNSSVVLSPKQTEEGKSIVQTAKSYVGTIYKSGGIDKKGIDCSGLLFSVFQAHGYSLPRTSQEQSKVGKAVYIGELQAGDLIFFGEKEKSQKVTHAGIISFSDGKNIRFIHASTSKGVREDDLAGYWRPLYINARRLLK